MPLSVPLKTSRTATKEILYATGPLGATQAAAQLAALTGAAAVTSPNDTGEALGVADSLAETRAPQPIPPATGAVWGHGANTGHKSHPSYREPKQCLHAITSDHIDTTKPVLLANSTPHAVIKSFQLHEREREAKHWDSKGKQVVSSRATRPSFSFHNGPSGRVTEEKGRCREIAEHPMIKNPGPQEYVVDPIKANCLVPRGGTTERRFRGGPFDTGEVDAAVNPTKLIKFSTEAHPFSSVYPYADTKPSQRRSPTETDVADAPLQESSVADERVQAQELPPSAHIPSEDADRKNPIRTTDLNAQYFKYKQKPTFGFGSSGLGFRFRPGFQCSKKPALIPHQRMRGFRERRELEHPHPTAEKHYQVALDEALKKASEAQEAAAAAAAAASAAEATPAPARSGKSTMDKRTASNAFAEENNSVEAPGGTATSAITNTAIAAETAPVAMPDASKEVATPT